MVLRERFVDGLKLLDPFLRVVNFALQHHGGAREAVDHLRAARVQLLLPAAHLFEFPLLFLDRLLLALEGNELFLSFLHLRIEVFSGHVVVVWQV